MSSKLQLEGVHGIMSDAQVAWAGGTRVAGVSSFGFSGTNAHVVLRSAPETGRSTQSIPECSGEAAAAAAAGAAASDPTPPQQQQQQQLLLLSARSAAALRQKIADVAAVLSADADCSVHELAATALHARQHFVHFRCAFVGGSAAQLQPQLAAAVVPAERRPAGRLALAFTGQGVQQYGMGRQLYAEWKEFRTAYDVCLAVATQHMPETAQHLRDTLLATPAGAEPPLSQHPTLAQLSLFALQYALATAWRTAGAQVTAVIGHSLGELAAACCADILTLEQAIVILLHRTRSMTTACAQASDGKMLRLGTARESAQALVDAAGARAWIAVLNSPEVRKKKKKKTKKKEITKKKK